MSTVLIYRITDAGFARVTDNSLDLRIIDSVAMPLDLFTPTSPGDISTVWQPQLGYGDWQLAGPLLQSGTDLDTALLISLFTDRVAAADDEIPDGTDDRRGWWGDDGEEFPIGSRLWLLDRGKLTTQTALAAKNYITEALQWMLTDGVAARVVVETAVQLPDALAAQIQIFRQDGTQIARNFAWVWQKVG